VEVPFVKTLLSMEKRGIKLDSAFMTEFKKEVESKIKELTAKMYELCGDELTSTPLNNLELSFLKS